MESTKNIDYKYWLHCAVFLILMFGIGMLPPFGQVTEYGMSVLGIFVGLMYAWVTLGFIWPSMLGLFVYATLQPEASITTTICNAFSASMIWQIFFVVLFAEILRKLGIMEYIGYWTLSQKICIGKPWVFTAILFIVAIIGGGLVSTFGTIFMLFAILFDICKKSGFTKQDVYVGYAIAGIVVMATVSCAMFPFRSFAFMVTGLLQSVFTVTEMPMIGWTITGLAYMGAFLVLYLILGKYILKIDVSKLHITEEDFAEFRGQKMTKENKIALVFLVAFILLMLLPSVLPASWPLISFMKGLELLGTAFLCITLALILKNSSTGKELVNFNDLAKGMNWDIIIMFLATLPIGAAMESGDTGILNTVIGWLTPIITAMSPMVFMIFAIVVFWAVTQFAHNMVLFVVFVPMLTKIAISFGINPLPFALAFATALQFAFVTPAGSANAVLIFSSVDWIEKKNAYKLGFFASVIGLFVILCVMLPLAMLTF